MKYQKWLNTWLDVYVKPTVKIRTYEKYEQIARTRIANELGDLEVDDLTLQVLQTYVINLGLKFSPNSINGTITVLQKSLKMAEMLGFTKKSYANSIKRPKVEEKRVDAFSFVEQKRIEQYILSKKSKKLYGVIISLYTGLRIGELLALEWSDIDFTKKVISVTKSCHYGKDLNGKPKRIVEMPKTVSSVRLIPISQGLLAFFKELKKDNPKYVLCDKGKPILTRSYQNTFTIMLNKLNIEHKGFHSLRHTFATRAIESGMDVKTLSELLGHKNANITLNRYAHSLIEHKKNVINKFVRYCGLKSLEG